MAQNRPPWLRLATQRFDLPARPVPTPIPAATPPQASVPTISPAPIPPRALAPAPVQSTELASAPTPAPTATPARAPSPRPAFARAPSPTPALAPVRAQPPQRQVSQPTPTSPALRPAPPAAAATPPRAKPPSPSPPQRQAFQPAPPSPQSRTSPPALAPPQASKSQPASPSPPLQLKGSPPPPQPQSPKTAQPPSLTAPPFPSPVHKPKSVLEIVKNQVITKYPTAAMEVKEADRVVPVKNVPPNSHVAAITDSEKRNHTPPQHSKIDEGGNSGPGPHRNRIIQVRDDEDNGMRIIAISGENNGATMEIVAGRRGAHNVTNGGEKHKKEAGNNAAAKEGELAKKEPGYRHKPVSAIVNSNVQSVNNSIVYGCNCAHDSPGVHLGLHGKPAVFKPRGGTDHHSSGHKDQIAGSV